MPDRPGSTSEVPGARRGSLDAAGEDERVLPAAATADRGRWRVIVLALVLTGAIAFGLTRGGELDAPRSGQEQARAEPAGPTEPSDGSTPPALLVACSGGPKAPAY